MAVPEVGYIYSAPPRLPNLNLACNQPKGFVIAIYGAHIRKKEMRQFLVKMTHSVTGMVTIYFLAADTLELELLFLLEVLCFRWCLLSVS